MKVTVNGERADLPNGIYQVVGCGCANRCTTYDSINNRVICGCWNDGDGNHLESFEQRVEDIYGFHGKTPNAELYAEYRAAINFFKTVIKVENHFENTIKRWLQSIGIYSL